MSRYLLVLSLAAASLACTAGYQYTRTTQAPASPKPQDCTFEVFTTRPDRPYDELGVLDWDGMFLAAQNMKQFIEVIRPHVCEAGGDAVISDVNGAGDYIRGTIIRFR